MNRKAGVGLVLAAIVFLLAGFCADPVRRMVGDPGPARVDLFGTHWVYAYVGEVLAGRADFPATNLVFYPYGKDLYAHTGGNVLDAVFAWPLRALFGSIAGYGLWIGVLLASNAWGAARLAAALGVGTTWRWTASLAAVGFPYALVEISQGRPTQAWLFFPALFMADWWSAVEGDGGRGRAARAGLWLALSAFQYWYYGILLGAVALLHGLSRPGRLGPAAIAGAVALAIALPAAWPMFGHLDAGDVPGLMSVGEPGPVAPVVLTSEEGEPLPLHVLGLDGRLGELREGHGALARQPLRLQLGFGLGLVGVLGLAARRPRALPWVAVPLLVALGPAWGWAEEIGVDSPAWSVLFASSSVLRRWWFPVRAVAPAGLMLAVGLALGVERVATRPWRGWVAVAGLVSLAAFEGWRGSVPAPLPTWPSGSTPVLTCLRAAPAGAVFVVPPRRDQGDLFAQVFHRHPIADGMPAGRPALYPKGTRGLFALPWVRHLRAGGAGAAPTAGRAEVEALGFRYVLVDLQTLASQMDATRRALRATIGVEVADDGRYALWTLDGSRVDCSP